MNHLAQKSVIVPDPYDHPGPHGEWLRWELRPQTGWPRIELPAVLEKDLDRYLEAIRQETVSPELGREFCDFLINRLVPSLRFYLNSFRDRIVTKIENSPAYALSIQQENQLTKAFWGSDGGRFPDLNEGYVLLWSSFFVKKIRPLLEAD